MNLVSEIEYWNKKVTYEDMSDVTYKHILKMCDLNLNDKSIGLDVGCASGALTSRIKLGKVIGIDISFSLLENCFSLTPIQANAKSIPLQDSSLDWIICQNSFHHIDEKDKSLHEIYRCLKSGGIFCIVEPNVYHPQRNLTKNPKCLIRKCKLLGSKNLVPSESYFPFDKTVLMLLNTGFTKLTLNFFTPLYARLSFLASLQYCYSWLFTRLFKKLIHKKYIESSYFLRCYKKETKDD